MITHDSGMSVNQLPNVNQPQQTPHGQCQPVHTAAVGLKYRSLKSLLTFGVVRVHDAGGAVHA